MLEHPKNDDLRANERTSEAGWGAKAIAPRTFCTETLTGRRCFELHKLHGLPPKKVTVKGLPNQAMSEGERDKWATIKAGDKWAHNKSSQGSGGYKASGIADLDRSR